MRWVVVRKPLKTVGKFHVSRHTFFFLFLIEAAQKNEEKGDAKCKTNEFSNAAVFYTEGIEVSCKDVALNAVLYKKRAACHFFLGEFRVILDSQFSYNKRRRGRLVVTALLIEWSTLLSRCLSPKLYKWVTSNFDARDNRWTDISHFMLQKSG